MAGKANFSVVKGDTFSRNCTFRNKNTLTPVNLTGSIISGFVNEVPLNCAITNAALGHFIFGLTTIQTSALKSGINKIEIKITYADLTVQTLFSGNLNVVEHFA